MNSFLDQEIDKPVVEQPSQLLSNLVKESFSGKVIIVNPHDPSVEWCILMGSGRVYFATSTMGKRERLNYLLSHYFPEDNYEIPKDLKDDYHFLCRLWQEGKIPIAKIRQIITKLTQEALMQSLSLPQGNITMENSVELNHFLVSLSIKETLLPVRNQLRYWVQMQTKINSPFQRPLIENLEAIKNQSWLNNKSYHCAAKIKALVNDHLCLYEIAHQLKQHILEIATSLHPLVNFGAVTMLPYRLPNKEQRPIIACIDDSQAIQKIVKMTLEMSGFKVISILEPAMAMTTFVTEKPNLILMDINMPDIDGYKLSYMFRQSTLLQDIPIIMLTGRDGIVDRVRAKMVGAINYISKPFMPQELIDVVNAGLGAHK